MIDTDFKKTTRTTRMLKFISMVTHLRLIFQLTNQRVDTYKWWTMMVILDQLTSKLCNSISMQVPNTHLMESDLILKCIQSINQDKDQLMELNMLPLVSSLIPKELLLISAQKNKKSLIHSLIAYNGTRWKESL